VSQETSRTAIIATIAAELCGVPSDEQPAWFRAHLEVAIGAKGRKRALLRRKQPSPLDARKGRKPSGHGPADVPDGWIWDGVGVDLQQLDLERALVVFEPSVRAEQLVAHLRDTVGVVEVLEMYGDQNATRVVARVVYWGAQRRAQIDHRLREAGVGFEWWAIRRESPNQPFEELPAAKTWAELAHQMAEIEGYTV
jgi:hypothetical protein